MVSRQPWDRELGEGGQGWAGSLTAPTWPCNGGPGRATARKWRRPGPLSSCEKDTQRNQGPEDDGYRNITLGGRRDTETRRDLWKANPQGPRGTWVQAEGGNGGQTMRDMTADAGMRRGAQSERRMLARGGHGRSTVGRRYVSVKELRSGCRGEVLR